MSYKGVFRSSEMKVADSAHWEAQSQPHLRGRHFLCRAEVRYEPVTVVRVKWALARFQSHPEARTVAKCKLVQEEVSPTCLPKGSSSGQLSREGWL